MHAAACAIVPTDMLPNLAAQKQTATSSGVYLLPVRFINGQDGQGQLADSDSLATWHFVDR